MAKKKEKFFMIINSGINLDDPTYRDFAGKTYSEESLRKWVRSWRGIPFNSSLKKIASEIGSGGWDLFQYIPSE